MKTFNEWMETNLKEWSSGGRNFRDEHEKNRFWSVVHNNSQQLKPILKKAIEEYFKNDNEARSEINGLDPRLVNAAIGEILSRLSTEYERQGSHQSQLIQ